MHVVTALDPPPSPARTREPDRPVAVVGVVQHRWYPEPGRTEEELLEGVRLAAGHGAGLVLWPELTLSRYPADVRGGPRAYEAAEDLRTGPTVALAAQAAREHGVAVQASLYERAERPDPDDGLGFNTAVLVGPDGEVVARTRKLHIPVTEGYHEDTFFRPGPAGPEDPYPVVDHASLHGVRLGMPTCWDEWFPEVARAYALGGADLLVYPTAIGSEPGHPGFDTEPLWRQVILGHGIANGLFVAVPNRWGDEGTVTFYGSSFVADPYGRVLARAPRDASAVLVAALDLAQRRDWLELFPFLGGRRPETYGALVRPRTAGRDPRRP